MSAAAADPRLGPIHWPMPDQREAPRRAFLMALVCAVLAVWYLSWLLGGAHIGNPVLFGLLIAAEGFNLIQAIGFWWTCTHQRMRPGRAPVGAEAVDVLIPVHDEPIDVVEPTVAGAASLHGADVRVWLLDDGRRSEMESLASRYRLGYLTREENVGAKAGNLNNALGLTSAPYVAVLDCDHVPRPEFLARTTGYLDDFGVAFVQTPQYYANGESGPIAAAAAAQQNLFFGPIARGKDGLGAIFCCGTNVVFRRSALEEVGGFSEDSVTEDFELSVRLYEAGWRSVYVPEVLACGLGPEDMASYVSQQQRWARGCLGAIPLVLRSRLPWRTRLQYLLSSTYFLSGLTLLIYMSLPLLLDPRAGGLQLAAAPTGQVRGHPEARHHRPSAPGGGPGAARGRRPNRDGPLRAQPQPWRRDAQQRRLRVAARHGAADRRDPGLTTAAVGSPAPGPAPPGPPDHHPAMAEARGGVDAGRRRARARRARGPRKQGARQPSDPVRAGARRRRVVLRRLRPA